MKERSTAARWDGTIALPGSAVPGRFGLQLGSEPACILAGPILGGSDRRPCLDVVRHRVVVPVSRRNGRGKHHVDPHLQRSDDREPLQQRRHVLTTRRDHPLGLSVELLFSKKTIASLG